MGVPTRVEYLSLGTKKWEESVPFTVSPSDQLGKFFSYPYKFRYCRSRVLFLVGRCFHRRPSKSIIKLKVMTVACSLWVFHANRSAGIEQSYQTGRGKWPWLPWGKEAAATPWEWGRIHLICSWHCLMSFHCKWKAQKPWSGKGHDKHTRRSLRDQGLGSIQASHQQSEGISVW